MGAGKAIKSGTHKNKTAWVAHKHQEGLKITDEMVQEIGWLDHCCEKCCDVLVWRRKYAKYKPLSQAGKCNRCQAKEVRRPYHSLCQPCASQTSQCAKCQQPYAIPQEVLDREAKMKYIKSKLGLLPERYRRSAERKLEKEEQDMDEIVTLVDRALRKREEEREGRKVTKVGGDAPAPAAAAAADGEKGATDPAASSSTATATTSASPAAAADAPAAAAATTSPATQPPSSQPPAAADDDDSDSDEVISDE